MSEYLVKYLHKIDCNNYSAGAEKLKIPPGLQALLAQLLAKDERYAELSHFVNSKVFFCCCYFLLYSSPLSFSKFYFALSYCTFDFISLSTFQILEPSILVALELLQAGNSCLFISKLGLNMLRQLPAHGEYLSVLLEKGRLLEGLRYARQNRVRSFVTFICFRKGDMENYLSFSLFPEFPGQFGKEKNRWSDHIIVQIARTPLLVKGLTKGI